MILILYQKAQEISQRSKKGQVITPVTGDIGLGIEATPFLEYAGDLVNFGNGSTNATAPTFDGFSNQIRGRYFLDNETAIRGSVRFDLGQTVRKELVNEYDSDGEIVEDGGVNSQVENKAATRNTDIYLAGGLEKRRGYGRLQGFYGAELGLLFNGGSTVFTYGNEYDNEAEGGAISDIDNTPDAERDLKRKDGLQIGIGVNAVIGAEYFFARKMSVGGELSLGLFYSTTPVGEREYEGLDDDGDPTVSTQGSISPDAPEGSFGFQTSTGSFDGGVDGLGGGSIYLSFYF